MGTLHSIRYVVMYKHCVFGHELRVVSLVIVICAMVNIVVDES